MAHEIRAHITGSLWKIAVAEGQTVAEEETLVIMESMKMEIPIASPVRGVVRRIVVPEGTRLAEGDLILIVEETA
jgi:biotin carboxyl carrier protein